MNLPSIPLVILDTETTGFVPRAHKVIEFASAEVREGKLVKEYEQLFHHADVPPVVQALTRIKTTDLSDKPPIGECISTVMAHLPEDALIVGQNITFDLGMLKGENMDLSGRPWVDTSMLASLVFPELESYSLGYLSTVLQLNHDPPHRALGDVRATLELFGKCWERFLELPEELRQITLAIMNRAPQGYRMLFEALPEAKKKKDPSWLKSQGSPAPIASPSNHLSISAPSHSPALLDEPLDPLHLQSVIESALASSTRTWIAVKNLRTTLERLPASVVKKLRVLHPPYMLIDATAVKRFSEQESYTADEATLAVKLAWYEPLRRDEFPLHGGEDAVWNGKLSCTETSKEYLRQFDDMPPVVLLDHRELLEFLQNPDHPGAKSMQKDTHVIIDDASMLEDTASKAFGWYCAMDDVRAASEGNELLTRFTDTLSLWVEKTRQFQDLRYLAHSDLTNPDSKGVRSLLSEVLKQPWASQLLRHLESLQCILDPENLAHRIAWIEQRPNGSQSIHSVPERIGQLLAEQLFSRFPVTLLIPQGSSAFLPEILPPGKTIPPSHHPTISPSLPISFDPHPTLEEIVTSPPPGKTIILLPSRTSIEDMYVKHNEHLDARGVKLLCQGVSGGMGRMRAEFLAAPAPAIWILTPWMYEGVDVPQGTVERLIIKTLPFDHPSHPVLSRRAQHYRDAFGEYSLARLLHRLFRLLRTFARIKTGDADVRILDDRVSTKEYGKRVKAYLQQFASNAEAAVPGRVLEPTASEEGRTEKKPVKKKKSDNQLSMF